MTKENRLELLALVLGALAGALASGWLCHHFSTALATTLGLIFGGLAGALGGFLRQTIVEALVVCLVATPVVLFVCHVGGTPMASGSVGLWLFPLGVGLVVGGSAGQLAGSFTKL